MPEIILRDTVVADDWQVVRPGADAPLVLPAGRVIVPLAAWLEQQSALAARRDVGVWLSGTDDPAKLAPSLASLSLVAIDFPKFTDGRGYSIAYLLRSRFGYRGELRAIGDVLPDQLFYMKRVGFDAFAVRADKDIRQALQSLRPFTDSYQGSWDNAVPAFRRHERAWPPAQSKS
ncbi:MAG TPA: DUF934 domain-containing protein [Burkholderiales bacterium]|nr:DUF934 domain-containing protein [Burkholderiales bacterium]